MRRQVVMEKYAADIAALYDDVPRRSRLGSGETAAAGGG
jgi:hypothetical protein